MISNASLDDLEEAARDMLAGRTKRAPLMNEQDVLAFVAEVRRLRAAVLHFGQHDPSCPVRQEFTRDNPACLCGLDALAPPAEVAGTDA